MMSGLPRRGRAAGGRRRAGRVRRRAAVALTGLVALLTGVSGLPAQTPEERLAELGIELPTPDAPTANFVKAVTTGNLVFLAGHGPCGGLDETNTGKVGLDHTVEEGYAIARWVGICLLASLAREIGDLSRVKRIVRVFGMVNTPPDFTQHSQVINGCSDLMEQVFGPAISKHARAAVGMASLPRDQSVEIEMLVELHDP
ncbi:RidA family protein [Candidatus Palauibacter sp.]|uniref:RidA family protein n=1 Tax=Candidatus Palauibacter sp. TaxID=3101350 RepID=UPI003B025B28